MDSPNGFESPVSSEPDWRMGWVQRTVQSRRATAALIHPAKRRSFKVASRGDGILNENVKLSPKLGSNILDIEEYHDNPLVFWFTNIS